MIDLGIDEEKMKIMDSELTKLTVPVRPGRNLSVIIEVAAMDYRMKRLGRQCSRRVCKKVNSAIIENPEQVNEERTE